MTVQEYGYLQMQDIYHEAMCVARDVISSRGLTSYPLLSKDFNWRFSKVKVIRRQA